MSVIRSVVAGCGSFLPEKVLTNADLAKMVDTSDEWIVERTGIHRRHIAADDEKTSDLALAASRKALEDAGMNADDLDMIILATTTPDNTFPATATAVQAGLGMHHGAAFDVQAVCSGFVYAVAVANNFIAMGQARAILVIGAETFSRLLDWDDRGTCVLFGDGAGAIVLKAEEQSGTNEDRGVLTAHLHSDGRYKEKLYVDGGPGSTSTVGHVRMEGREVFRHAVVNIAEAIEEALAATGFTADDIDWFVPHQANKRILDATAKRIGLAPEKVVITVGEQGNTSAASVPLALDAAVKDGRIKRGDLVLLEAMGGGFTWGSALVRW
ncbi:3-oxoacyl-(acyl-carrier-protein) synthase III [Tepidicaulis marinus]|uniref:Beta-ketoacyl-[acyl-carrier-protein] synthase III n=1 Tax=Tepidicaulis marinus TaxID=1333998 RepID=A0A081B7T5_9HYPH|nr:beta-ketoacyl-ACP synthase III [Tepidicaulis marinus]GAK44103.1 3-oxoacyl-(acyl-carrier-protein) synthase III [Tepidicaulis marinus]